METTTNTAPRTALLPFDACECGEPTCPCSAAPCPARVLVRRDGVVMGVCGDCELPADVEVVASEPMKVGAYRALLSGLCDQIASVKSCHRRERAAEVAHLNRSLDKVRAAHAPRASAEDVRRAEVLIAEASRLCSEGRA